MALGTVLKTERAERHGDRYLTLPPNYITDELSGLAFYKYYCGQDK
jgi:hypothetical protein